jgi:hypothetical protein
MRSHVTREVRLQVVGYPDSDRDERAELAWRLQEELRGLDIHEVSRPSTRPPPGAKGAALDWAELIVTLSGSLPLLITAVRSWSDRHPNASVSLEIDGDQLTVNDASSSEARELIDLWLKRHGGR